MSDTFPRIRISGDRATRSRQYGELAKPQILHTRAGYERAYAAKGVSWQQAIAQAMSYVPAIERELPHLLVEIRGIAEGSGLTFEDVMAMNCRSEILHAVTVANAGRIGDARGECTSFALEPDRTAAGEAIVGQNWDWLEYLDVSTIVLEVEREDGPNYVTVVEAGLLAKMILTQSGLGIGINTLVTSLDGTTNGVPFHFVIRALADAPHIAGALEQLAALPRTTSGNYIFASASGAVLNVEASPGGPANVSPQFSRNGAIVHANHFIDPVPGGHDLGAYGMPDSFVRLGRIIRLVGSAEAKLDDSAIRAALADHAEFPNSVCCHPEAGGEPGGEKWKTIAAVIMRPAARTLDFTVGPPCENAWQSADFSELLAAAS